MSGGHHVTTNGGQILTERVTTPNPTKGNTKRVRSQYPLGTVGTIVARNSMRIIGKSRASTERPDKALSKQVCQTSREQS